MTVSKAFLLVTCLFRMDLCLFDEVRLVRVHESIVLIIELKAALSLSIYHLVNEDCRIMAIVLDLQLIQISKSLS